MVNIYCGNLSYDMTVEDLKSTFEDHGDVSNAKIITDKESGRSKGFGFVEMENADEAKAAIHELNGALVNGRTLRVSEARARSGGGTKRRSRPVKRERDA